MADFSDNGNSGCFYKMLRRISCFRSLPTHPADHILESKTIKSENQKENPKAAASPGIVARLMGLDSLPDNNWVSRKGIPDSVVRSRSVNFVDYLLEFDLSTQAQHRRVRTSVSFREVPTLSQQQNRDVLVVRLNDGDETKGMRSKVRKSEMGFGEMKQRKEQRSKNKETNRREKEAVKKKGNQGNSKISKLRDEPRKLKVSARKNERSKTKSPLKPINQKKQFVESKFTGKRKIQHLAVKLEPECDSQNASPVSVLDVNDCVMQQELNISEPSKSMELNLNRKSSGRASYADDLREGVVMKNKDCDSMDISERQYYKEVLGNLCRLTENDIKESNWIAKNFLGFEGFEEVCMEFEQQVLDVLLNQVVDEFVEIP